MLREQSTQTHSQLKRLHDHTHSPEAGNTSDMSTKAPLCSVSLVRLIFPTKWKAIVFKLFFRLSQRVRADPQRERVQHLILHNISYLTFTSKLSVMMSNSRTLFSWTQKHKTTIWKKEQQLTQKNHFCHQILWKNKMEQRFFVVLNTGEWANEIWDLWWRDFQWIMA